MPVKKNVAIPSVPEIALYLAEKAAQYFPDLGDREVRVSLRKKLTKAGSSIYRFDLRTRLQKRSVVVKLKYPHGQMSGSDSMPASATAT